MALKNRDNSLTYLRLKAGKFQLGKDGESFDELEGTIVDIRYKDEEYENLPQRKAYFYIADGDERYALGLNVESGSYGSLVSFLANVNVGSKLTLHPKENVTNKDGKNVTNRTILVSQDGKFAKNYFTKDDPHGLPKWNIQQVGKQKVTDKSAYTDFLEQFVLKTFVPKLTGTPATIVAHSAAQVEDNEPEAELATTVEKMPWE